MKRIVLAFALLATAPASAETRSAYVAGGCFWCVESDFESVAGVSEVISGYTGGAAENPTYKQVGRGDTGHFEAVEIRYDPTKVDYATLMNMFLRSIDATDSGGQFCDRGSPYKSAIFVSDPAEKAIAEAAVAEAEKALGAAIATEILPLGPFWPAEEYHQDYYKGSNLVLTRGGPKRQSDAYAFYREGCGRDARVRELWGDQAPFARNH